MPAEIADSDAESDFGSPAKVQQTLPMPPPESPRSTASNDLGVHFSDFISQSPRVEEFRSSQVLNSQGLPSDARLEFKDLSNSATETPEPATASSLKQDVVQSEPAATIPAAAKSKKRRHNTLNDADKDQDLEENSRKKQRQSRVRTYGGSSGLRRSTQTQIFTDLVDDADHRERLTAVSAGPAEVKAGTVHFDHSMQPPPTAPSLTIDHEHQGDSPRQRQRPRRVISLIQQSNAETLRDISTSRSSMGNYESININNIDTNPFGSLSQTSVEEDVNDIERVKMSSMTGSDNIDTSALLRTSAFALAEAGERLERHDEGGYEAFHSVDYETVRPMSVDLMSLYNDLPNDTQLLSSSINTTRERNNIVGNVPVPLHSSAVDEAVVSVDGSISDQDSSHSQVYDKNRRRKRKGQYPASKSPATVDETQPKANSDEAAIGLPEEQYKPRPSRSRGGTDEFREDVLPEQETSMPSISRKEEPSSPVKQPTSELHLSDEAFVGLPKENYKPRPSRSRSKRTIDEDDEPSRIEPVLANETQPPASAAMAPPVTKATPVKKAKKTPKKIKVKRAKTMAASLQKKTEEMLSEGEDDVLWLETQPAKVKLDLPQGLSPAKALKVEQIAMKGQHNKTHEAPIQAVPADNQTDNGEEAESEDDDIDISANHGKGIDNQHVFVQIPAPTAVLQSAEPKKRGRKKKIIETFITVDAQHEADEHIPKASGSGVGATSEEPEILPEKPEPKKRGRKKKVTEVHVNEQQGVELEAEALESEMIDPLEKEAVSDRPALAEMDVNKPTSKNVTSKNTDSTSSSPKGDHNDGQPAPPELETPVKPQSGGKGSDRRPTKHSPINPSGGRALYRVGLSRRAPIPSLLRMLVRKDPEKEKDKGKQKGKATAGDGGELDFTTINPSDYLEE